MQTLFERIRPAESFPSGLTKEHLTEQLSGFGIAHDDSLLVHSSVGAVGDIVGGAATLCEALCDTVPEGLLLAPVHTWATIEGTERTFDPLTEPSCTGILGEVLLKRNGSVRTLNATHSVAVCGRGAERFADGEQFSPTPCARTGCMGKLLDRNGKILLIGVGLDKCTFLHGIEEWCSVPDRLSEPTVRYISTPSGVYFGMYRGYDSSVGDVSRFFPKLEAPLLELGVLREYRLGEARCLLAECAGLLSAVSRFLIARPELFSDRRAVPKVLVRSVERELAQLD